MHGLVHASLVITRCNHIVLNFKESFGNVVDPYFAWCYKSHSISLCLIIAKKIQNGDQPSPLHRIDACVHVRRIIGKLVNKETKAI
jgi:hypothetical protein